MLRFLAGVGSALLLVTAGFFLFRGRATPELPPPPPASTAAAAPQALPAPEVAPPAASPRTREQKRFGRYDKDRDGRITRDEYLASRRKAYGKLDANGDGRLSFEEWAARTTAKFGGADRDRSATLDPAEFATTAVKRKARAAPRCLPMPADEG